MRAIFFFLEPERGCREITFFSPDFHKKKSPAEFRAIWHGLFCGKFLFLHCLHFHLKFPMYKHREWLHGNGDRKHPLPYMRNNHRYTRYHSALKQPAVICHAAMHRGDLSESYTALKTGYFCHISGGCRKTVTVSEYISSSMTFSSNSVLCSGIAFF